MPYCSNCGNANPDGAKFCSQCGAKLATEAPVDDPGTTVDLGSPAAEAIWVVG